MSHPRHRSRMRCEAGRWHAPGSGGYEIRHLLVGCFRTGPCHDRLVTARGRERGCSAGRHQPEVGRQSDRKAGAGSEQRHVFQGRRQPQEIVVRYGIDDRDPGPVLLKLLHSGTDRLLSGSYRAVVDQANPMARLGLQHSDQVGVPHRRQRMVPHAAFTQQTIANEEMPLEHCPLVVRKGRRRNREGHAQRLHQRIGHGTDVAFGRAVEASAIHEVDLPRALRLQPLQGVE